jgi:hypothetical protein
MSRDRFELNGIDERTKEALKDAALKRFGKANAALMIRALIADHLRGSLFDEPEDESAIDLTGEVGRLELSLPQSCIDELDRRAELRLSPRNYYICNLIFSDLGKPQLLIDEANILVSSNYEMAGISNSLHSIARSYSLSVKNGVSEGFPQFNKALNKLKSDIDKHISLVMKMLSNGTVIIESKGKGRGQVKTKNSNI